MKNKIVNLNKSLSEEEYEKCLSEVYHFVDEMMEKYENTMISNALIAAVAIILNNSIKEEYIDKVTFEYANSLIINSKKFRDHIQEKNETT